MSKHAYDKLFRTMVSLRYYSNKKKKNSSFCPCEKNESSLKQNIKHGFSLFCVLSIISIGVPIFNRKKNKEVTPNTRTGYLSFHRTCHFDNGKWLKVSRFRSKIKESRPVGRFDRGSMRSGNVKLEKSINWLSNLISLRRKKNDSTFAQNHAPSASTHCTRADNKIKQKIARQSNRYSTI